MKTWLFRLVGFAVATVTLTLFANLVAKVVIVISRGLWDMLGSVVFSWRTAALGAVALIFVVLWDRAPGLPSTGELKKHWRAWALGLLLVLTALVALGEIRAPNLLGFRADDPSATFWVDEDHPHRPPARVTTNRYGYRDDPWNIEPPPGVVRVLLIGDSYVYGKGIPDEDGLLDRQIEAQLESLQPDARWQVLNLGYPGQGFLSYFDLARIALERFDPRLVVIGSLGGSDWDLLEVQEQFRMVGPTGFALLTSLGVTEDLWHVSVLAARSMPRGSERAGDRLVSDRMRSLLETADAHGVDVVLWEYYDPHPFFERHASHPRMHITGWPADFDRSWDGWGNDPRLSIPVDRHPTAAANALIAEHLAPELIRITSNESDR